MERVNTMIGWTTEYAACIYAPDGFLGTWMHQDYPSNVITTYKRENQLRRERDRISRQLAEAIWDDPRPIDGRYAEIGAMMAEMDEIEDEIKRLKSAD